MPKIKTYGLDTKVTGRDKVIGTDYTGSVTKNYSVSDLSYYVGTTISLAGQLVYLASDTINPGTVTGISDGEQFSNITQFRFSSIENNGQNVVNYLQEFGNMRVMIVNTYDKNQYGIYDVTSVTEDPVNSSYYLFDVSLFSSNGFYNLDVVYRLSQYVKDLNYRHYQSTPSTTWDVTHNLGKFPSVTVTLSTGKQGQADVTHVNKNRCIITFLAAKTGYANLN